MESQDKYLIESREHLGRMKEFFENVIQHCEKINNETMEKVRITSDHRRRLGKEKYEGDRRRSTAFVCTYTVEIIQGVKEIPEFPETKAILETKFEIGVLPMGTARFKMSGLTYFLQANTGIKD